LPVHRFSQVSFVEKSAGNSKLAKFLLQDSRLSKRFSEYHLNI